LRQLGFLVKTVVNVQNEQTVNDWIKGEMCEEHLMSVLGVCQLKIKRLVCLLMPVGKLETDVEHWWTQHE